MKKAILVVATSVAFLLSGTAFAARKVVDMPSTGTILKGSTSSIAENGILKVTGGALVGEYIPGVSKALSIVPETKIATSAITGLAKNAIRGGLAGVVGGVIIGELIDGVGWVMDEGGTVRKIGTPDGGVVSTPGGFYQWEGSNRSLVSSAQEGCFGMLDDLGSVAAFGDRAIKTMTGFTDERHANCQAVVAGQGIFLGGATTIRYGEGCPTGSSYNPNIGACVGSGSLPAPITEADMTVLDGFIKGKDGVWQRGLTEDLCKDNDSCYKALSPETSLTGPSKVTGTPQTVTTTSPSGTTTVSTKTPTSTITYGPNYYDYSTSTTTTTNNGGDTTTTTDDRDVSFPVPPDIFGGANDGLGGIRDSIPSTSSSTSPIPYMAWWSFSQSCEEITFILPVYGAVTTAFCPVYKKYIWPILYFFFAVFTWLHCFDIWRKTVMRVRAS